MKDLDLLEAEIVGARPAWADTLSPAALRAFNDQVTALYDKGMKPDEVDRRMATFGPSYFENQARAKAPARPAAPLARPVARAAGGAALAAKNCGADGDLQAWLLLCLCLLAVCLLAAAAAELRQRSEAG